MCELIGEKCPIKESKKPCGSCAFGGIGSLDYSESKFVKNTPVCVSCNSADFVITVADECCMCGKCGNIF